MNCDVVGLRTLYKVLRFIFRGVVHVAFEANIGDNFPEDHTANSSRFRVPFNTVTALEHMSHILEIFQRIANCGLAEQGRRGKSREASSRKPPLLAEASLVSLAPSSQNELSCGFIESNLSAGLGRF